MRKLIVSNIMSLDGYYTGPGNNVMVLPMDEAVDVYNAERLRAADTLLLGRTTYEGFKGFWPSVADDPKARPILREISRLDNAIDKVVVSDRITPRTDSAVAQHAHHQARGRPRADRRTQTPDRQRDLGFRQPHALERLASS